MTRPLIVLVVLSLAGAVSSASAQTPDIQEDIVEYQLTPNLRASMMREAAATRARLARRVNFSGIANPKTSLWDALRLWSDCCAILIEVHADAFRDEGVKKVFDRPIGRIIPKMQGVPASAVLSIILARIPSRSGVIFYPRGKRVEVGTTRAYLYELRLNGAIVSPTIPHLPRR